MKHNMASADARALRVANELRRRVNRMAGQLRKPSPETKRARVSVLAVGRHLQEVIATLESRRDA